MRGRVKADIAWGKKTEDALKEVGDSVKEVFRGVEESLNSMKLRPAWWSTGPGLESKEVVSAWKPSTTTSTRRPSQPTATPATVAEQPASVASVVWSHPAAASMPAPAQGAPAPAAPPPAAPAPPPAAPAPPPPERAAAPEDDGAMRRHCAALERLVLEIGLSPQAARAALRHLDAWLVGEAGAAEMAAAEAAAHASGEAILHAGDRVRLEGLVKNKDANGKHGILAAYRADDHRWKVVLEDEQVYWVRPKLLRPLELKRLPLPDPDATESAKEAGSESSTCQAVALAAGWARLEARQAAWKEEQEAREIELLEREMALHRQTEALEVQQETLQERRHTLALNQARTIAELQRRSSEPGLPGPKDTGPAQYFLDGKAPKGHCVAGETLDQELSVDESAAGDDESEACDEMWDTDWTTVSPQKAQASPAQAPAGLQRQRAGAGAEPGAARGGGASRAPSGTPSRSLESTPRSSLATPPSLEPAERELLQRRLEEKRRLADLHSGEDMSVSNRSEFSKGRMPGVHPDIAQKLQDRRRQLDEVEERCAATAALEGS